MSAYIQERDAGGTEDGEDLLLDQLMVGLCAGPIKQELSRQLRRDEQLTFSVACKEAQALEQELQEKPCQPQHVCLRRGNNKRPCPLISGMQRDGPFA